MPELTCEKKAHHNSDQLYSIWQLSFISSPCVVILCRRVTLFAAPASGPWVYPVGLSVYGLEAGAASSAGMLWERLFLLEHTELGLSLLLCTSDTHSWAVTDTSRDVDLCQEHKHTKLSRVSSCITCTAAPVHTINKRKERKGVGWVSHKHTHINAH